MTSALEEGRGVPKKQMKHERKGGSVIVTVLKGDGVQKTGHFANVI